MRLGTARDLTRAFATEDDDVDDAPPGFRPSSPDNVGNTGIAALLNRASPDVDVFTVSGERALPEESVKFSVLIESGPEDAIARESGATGIPQAQPVTADNLYSG